MKKDEKQGGQVLVQVALLLVVLLGFLALAVDVSQVYLKRRQLQNAADAAALEGARSMCFETFDFSPAGHAAAQIPAEEVALTNAPRATVEFPTADSIYAMTAVVREDIPSFVAGIVGVDEFGPGARATAICGGADTVCGLFPVAFSQAQWDMMKNHCGYSFYVWSGDKDDTPLDCNECNCDIDPGQAGDEVISEAGRAWLDFSSTASPSDPFADFCGSSTGCGASELKCWIESSSSVRITLPACISGDTGVKAGVKKEIEDRANLGPPGNIVSLPIYDTLCGAGGGGCSGKYHVTELGCVQIRGWIQNMTLYYKDDPTKKCWKDKLVEVAVSCGGCDTSCGSTSGTQPPAANGVNAVSLIE
jgi:hypothetical protein